jgi:hypothetical protein
MFSLLIPMPGLPWHLLPLWPLIFWRIQRLKAWFRAVGGPGSEMLWGVAWNRRVVVIQPSDDLTGPHPGIFRVPVSDRLQLALTDTPTPCSRQTPGLWNQYPRHLTHTPITENPYSTASAPSGAVRAGPYSNLRRDLP